MVLAPNRTSRPGMGITSSGNDRRRSLIVVRRHQLEGRPSPGPTPQRRRTLALLLPLTSQQG